MKIPKRHELKISQPYSMCHSLDVTLWRIKETTAPFLAPLQALLPLINTDEARDASTNKDIHALYECFMAAITLPPSVRTQLEDALAALIIAAAFRRTAECP